MSHFNHQTMQHGDQDQDGKGRFFYYWKPYLIDIASLAKWKFCHINNSDCSPSLHGTVEPIATWRGVTGKTRWTGQLLRNNVHVPLYRTSVANLFFWVGEYKLANILRGAAANIRWSKKINPSLLVSEKIGVNRNQRANGYWISMAFSWLVSTYDF
jgi:hypothetical protein